VTIYSDNLLQLIDKEEIIYLCNWYNTTTRGSKNQQDVE